MKFFTIILGIIALSSAEGCKVEEPDCSQNEVVLWNSCEEIGERYNVLYAYLSVGDVDENQEDNNTMLKFDMSITICVMNDIPSRLKIAFGEGVRNANKIDGVNITYSSIQFQCDDSSYKVVIDNSISTIARVDHPKVNATGMIEEMTFRFRENDIPDHITDDELILICTHEIGHMLGLRHPDVWANNHEEEEAVKIREYFSVNSIMYSKYKKPDGTYVDLTNFTDYDKENIEYRYKTN